MAGYSEDEIKAALELVKNKNVTKTTKVEFSKLWLIGCATFTISFVALSYILSFFDKNPLESLSSTIISTMCTVDAASFGGYVLQNCVRAYCNDKFCGGNYNNEN